MATRHFESGSFIIPRIILAIFIIIKIKAYKKRKKNNVCLSYLSLLPSKSNDSCGCRCSSGFISSPVNLAPTLLGLWTVHTKYTEVISPLGKEQLQLEICVSRKPKEMKEIEQKGVHLWLRDPHTIHGWGKFRQIFKPLSSLHCKELSFKALK